MFTLAHISDWHATTLEGAPLAALANKRFFGWQSWLRKRRKRHRPEVLRAVFDDVRACAPDHVVVTGDLTNVGLPQEFAEAAAQLRELGDPTWVTVVPGNHDAYVRVPSDVGVDAWAPYLCGDGAAADARAPRASEYPTLRVRDGVAIVGVCTARPTAWLLASGEVGAGQLARLEARLRALGERGLVRVVALHHPPTDEGVSWRRRLRDWRALQHVLARAGAELVVHGHRHRTWLGEIPGRGAPIAVGGTRSASDVGVKDAARAQYHLYRIERDGAQVRIRVEVRGWDRARRCMAPEREHAFASVPAPVPVPLRA
ncbi:MAG: metallophosphoesterase [Myxococcota bacterium]